MKNNLTQSLGQWENAMAQTVLQNIERHLPENPRYAFDASFVEQQRMAGLVALDKGDFWSGDESLIESFAIECHSGSLWMTLGTELRDDILLLPGQTYISNPDDNILVEALEDSRFRIIESRRR
jgi:hypothetical protein